VWKLVRSSGLKCNKNRLRPTPWEGTCSAPQTSAKTPISAVGPSASCFTLWVSFFRAPFLSPCCFNFPAPVWRALYATPVAGCVSEMLVVVPGAQRWNWVAQSQLQTPFMTRCLRYVTNLCCYCRENAYSRPQFGMIHKRLRLVLHTGFGATNDPDHNKIWPGSTADLYG